MPSDLTDTAPLPEPATEAPRAPLAGTRSQAMQRLQVGLFGLGTMVLLVAMANIIMNNLRQNEAQVVAEAQPQETAPETRPAVRDPLADAGVVPDMVSSRPAEGVAAPAGDVPPPQL